MNQNNGAPAATPTAGLRRRVSDSVRLGPLRRYTYECLLAAAVLPLLKEPSPRREISRAKESRALST